MTTYKHPIVLDCWSSNEHYNADCDVAVLEVTEELVQHISERHSLFQQMSKSCSDLAAVQFWDDTPDFFSLAAEPDDLEKAVVQMGVQQQSWLSSESPLRIPKERCQRLDSCWMEISPYGVQWRAIPKHSALHVATAEIELSVLQEKVRSAELPSPERGR